MLMQIGREIWSNDGTVNITGLSSGADAFFNPVTKGWNTGSLDNWMQCIVPLGAIKAQLQYSSQILAPGGITASGAINSSQVIAIALPYLESDVRLRPMALTVNPANVTVAQLDGHRLVTLNKNVVGWNEAKPGNVAGIHGFTHPSVAGIAAGQQGSWAIEISNRLVAAAVATGTAMEVEPNIKGIGVIWVGVSVNQLFTGTLATTKMVARLRMVWTVDVDRMMFKEFADRQI